MQRLHAMARTPPTASTSPSTTDEEIDSAAAATCTKIQAEARKITIRLQDVNENIICALCEGYFLDAHKITECAHTFCAPCIRRYFKADKRRLNCPACGTEVQPNRPSFLVADPVFQGIVDKLVPEFAAREVDERRAFYERHGFERKATNGPRGAETEPLANGHSADKASAAHDDTPSKPVEKISFDLHPQNGPGIPLFLHLAKLRQPRMRTDANFRIHFLRKYIALKLNLSSPKKVEILCRGNTLGNEYSLAFVQRTIWKDMESKMILEYRGTVV